MLGPVLGLFGCHLHQTNHFELEPAEAAGRAEAGMDCPAGVPADGVRACQVIGAIMLEDSLHLLHGLKRGAVRRRAKVRGLLGVWQQRRGMDKARPRLGTLLATDFNEQRRADYTPGNALCPSPAALHLSLSLTVVRPLGLPAWPAALNGPQRSGLS